MREIDLDWYDSEGPGDKDCPHCHGAGVILVPRREGAKGPPEYTRCTCTLRKDILANVEKGYKGLSKANPVKKSKLIGKDGVNLWITGDSDKFLRHLRHVAIRKPPTWHFKVTSDVDLMSAWLAGLAVKGAEILDADVSSVRSSTEYLTLVDLVLPPELLIIRVGVKAARNQAAPEVLLEALTHRQFNGLPTWVWDTPDYVLGPGHISYSQAVGKELKGWERVKLDAVQARQMRRSHLPDVEEVMGMGKGDNDVDDRLQNIGSGDNGAKKKQPAWKRKAPSRSSWNDDEEGESEEDDVLAQLARNRGKVED